MATTSVSFTHLCEAVLAVSRSFRNSPYYSWLFSNLPYLQIIYKIIIFGWAAKYLKHLNIFVTKLQIQNLYFDPALAQVIIKVGGA